MLEIHSRTTNERIIRNASFALLLSVFAAWFLWDGYVGYTRDNAAALLRTLGAVGDRAPEIKSSITSDESQRLREQLPVGTPVGEVTAVLGAPSLQQREDMYYIGPGGSLVVRVASGLVQAVEWKPGPHTESDLRWQKRMGYATALAALLAICHLVRVAAERVSLTQAGLKVPGRPLIPFGAMSGLRLGKHGDASVVIVDYSVRGRQRVLQLDSYFIREAKSIVSAICERTGLSDPRGGRQPTRNSGDSPAQRTEPSD